MSGASPESPLLVGAAEDSAHLRLTGRWSGETSHAVAISGKLAFAGRGMALVVLDIAVPSEPRTLGEVALPDLPYAIRVRDREVFIAAATAGLIVVNVADPARPRVVGRAVVQGVAVGLALDGNRAYVASWFSGVQSVDVADPARPRVVDWAPIPLLRSVDAAGGLVVAAAGPELWVYDVGQRALSEVDPVGRLNLGSVHGVAIDGSIAYVMHLGEGDCRLSVVDLVRPSLPKRLGTTQAETCFELSNTVVEVEGDRVITGGGGHFVIVDVSDPDEPMRIGRIGGWSQDSWDLTPGRHTGVAISGDLAFVAAGRNGLRVIVLDVPSAPRDVAARWAPHVAVAVAVQGDVAYLADAAAGLRILDVRDPALPKALAHVVTPGPVRDVAVAGGVAYLALGSGGLRTYDVGNPSSPRLLGKLELEYGAVDKVVVQGAFAYLLDSAKGLSVVEVSNPAAPVLRNTTILVGRSHDLAVGKGPRAETWVLVASDLGLRVLDVSQPDRPTHRGIANRALGEAIAFSGDWAYVIGPQQNLAVVDLRRIDSSLAPVGTSLRGVDVALDGQQLLVADTVGRLWTLDVTDPLLMVPQGLALLPDNARGLAMQGGRVYAAVGLNGLLTVDITDPWSPRMVGTDSVAQPGTELVAVAMAGRHAFAVANDPATLMSFDLADPTQPRLAAVLPIGPRIGGLSVDGDMAAIWGAGDTSNGPGHLALVDLADADHPRWLGTTRLPNLVGVALDGPRAYLAKQQGGIQVLSVANPQVPREVATVSTVLLLTMQRFGPLLVGVGRDTVELFGLEDVGPPRLLGVAAVARAAREAVVQDGILVVSQSETWSIFRVNEPTAPQFLHEAKSPSNPSALALQDSRLFMLRSGPALDMYDIRDPHSPALSDDVPLVGDGRSLAVSGRTVAVVGEGGLSVFTVEEDADRRLHALYCPWIAR